MKKLGFWELFALAVGSIIGTGIFIMPSTIAGMLGPGSMLVWAAVALLTIPMGYCFAELGGMFEKSGGPVLYAKKAFGDFWGFLAGWTMWAQNTIAISSLALAISFFTMVIVPEIGGFVTPFSLILIAAFTLINYLGAKVGANVQILLTASTIAIIGTFIALGTPGVKLSNFEPLFPLGIGAFGLAMAMCFESFQGWESSSLVSGEVARPKKTVPKVVKATTITVALLFVVMVFVAIGSAGWSNLSEAVAITEVIEAAAGFLIVSAIVVNMANLNAEVFTNSRVPYALAGEKLFPKYFGRLSRFGTPGRSLLLQAAIASLIVLPGSYEGAILLLLSSVFIMYILCFASLIMLRKSIRSESKAPWWFPHVSIAALVFLFVQVSPETIATGLVLVALGVPGYVAVKLLTDRRFVEKFWDRMNFAMNAYMTLLYGQGDMRHLLRNAKLGRGMTVLDYGCGTGKMTERVAEAVGDGKVVAADLSVKQLKKAVKRAEMKDLPNVMFVKVSRPAPFPAGTFDRIVCAVAINYFVNPERELKALRRTLKKGGVASFLAIKAPGIPLHKFLSSDGLLKSSFRKAHFTSVHVSRKKMLGKEHIYITARK
ncbi:MAG: amino acid permease [Candidatus Aenigmatarchaeota archaeon]